MDNMMAIIEIGRQVSMKRILSFGWRAYKKGNDSRIRICHS